MNRLIGYAQIRQVRQAMGTCRTAKVVRDSISSCTGQQAISNEDQNDYCLGWEPMGTPNCTMADEFKYVRL